MPHPALADLCACFAVEPCPICGAQGPCAYDAEGRPLIHTDTELPEDPQ